MVDRASNDRASCKKNNGTTMNRTQQTINQQLEALLAGKHGGSHCGHPDPIGASIANDVMPCLVEAVPNECRPCEGGDSFITQGRGTFGNGSSRSPIDFSFIFFSDSNQSAENKYQLVFDIAAFADDHEFTAVWLPERHFHPFGGIYPNPSILAAAIAVKTKHIRLRSGSVVLPLHHPAEVVEGWSMVDNLSNGRVDLGFASGWNPNDFITTPDTYQNRKQVWHDRIPMVQKLWQGESISFLNGNGKETAVQIYPKPIQETLNIWLVVTKSDESFHYAGTQGYNILTMLQGIDLDELGKKIQIYRSARVANGFSPLEGKVTLMLHTLVHEDLAQVESAVREPFTQYIKSALSGHIEGMKERPTEQEINKIVDYSYQRYFSTGALFGSVDDAMNVVEKAISVGVNEIACLMDFGIHSALVLESLPYLHRLKIAVAQSSRCREAVSTSRDLFAGSRDLASVLDPANKSRDVDTSTAEPIAIVGLHGFLPQAMNIQDFWQYLDKDQSVLTETPESRFDWRAYYDPTGQDSNKMRTNLGGFIPNIQDFDPAFFGILPQDAELIDPQQRLLLMSVYKTIEDAGYHWHDLKGSRTGVFIAIEDNEYLQYLRKNNVDLGTNGFNHHPSMAANRISYFFDFRGPSEIVNTMCSSAAVAIHHAATAIARGEIELAIVGGARILLDPEPWIGLSRMNVLSTSNTVRSFGENADGYLRAEGVASILLKPLSLAERDNDNIYAVIKSSAVNYNGQGGMSMAAPNMKSHIDVIKTCYKKAGIDVREVGYIEAQGMGNQVGDLAEWEACNRALEQLAVENQLSLEPGYCRVSTLKPMIGHMESVSALGALFKIIRSIHTNTLHKILNLETINPYLNTENRPCRLLSKTEVWPAKATPRLAALHSYGSGGSNAHILIEEYKNTKAERNTKITPYKFNNSRCWIDLKQSSKPSLSTNKITTDTRKRICVIGAGPSGLVMAKSLLEEGHCPVVFEKQSTLGGLWVLNENKTAGAYKKTRFQSSKFTSVFSDFYVDDIKNNFFTVKDVQHYLERYAEHFHLNSSLHYHNEVISVQERGNQWEVLVKKDDNISEHIFDGVALCQGSFWQPNFPFFKGLDEFTGKVIHSSQYFDNTIFQGKRVLVVGNGVSAMDIAEEAALVAETVQWSRRSTKLILPRMVGFVPNDCQSAASLLIEKNRTNIIERLKLSMPDYYQAYLKSGLLPSQEAFMKNPIVHINDGIIQLVADGKVIAKGPIEYFNEKGCVFSEDHDGSEQFDIIVFCTGYKNFGSEDARYAYIKNISVAHDFSMGMFYEKNPTLVNTSVLPIAFIGSFYFLEMVARWYAQLLSGQCLLTDAEKKSRITEDNYLIMGPISNVLFGMRLGLFPNPAEEFKAFWQLLNYPAFPMIHRLRGPHSHEQASLQLKQFVQTSYVKTEEGSDELKELKYCILAGLGKRNLDSLLLKQEINEAEYREAQNRIDCPFILDWSAQYINSVKVKKSPKITNVQGLFIHRLTEIVATILRINASDLNALKNLSEYGFDSISLTGLAREIVLSYPFIKLAPSTFLEYSNVHDLACFLYEKYEQELQQVPMIGMENATETYRSIRQYPELVVLNEGKRGVSPTFWFHAALGTVQMYSPLAQTLNRDLPFYAIAAKGIMDEQSPCDNLVEMAAYYSKILLSINQGASFQLGGYSQGGVLAYEVARQLQLAGEDVNHIVMIDAPFPPVITFLSEQHRHLLTLLNLLQMHHLGTWADIQDYHLDDVDDVDDDILNYLTRVGLQKGLPWSAEHLRSLLEKYSEVSDANLRAMHGYTAAPLPFPKQLQCYYFQRHNEKQFFGESLSHIDEFNQQNTFYQQSNCANRWPILLPNFNLYPTPSADHFSFFDSPAVLKIISAVCNKLYGVEQGVEESLI